LKKYLQEIEWRNFELPNNFQYKKLNYRKFRYDFKIDDRDFYLLIDFDNIGKKINKKNVLSLDLEIAFQDSITGDYSNNLNKPIETLKKIIALIDYFLEFDLIEELRTNNLECYLINKIMFNPFQEKSVDDKRREKLYLDVFKSYSNSLGLDYKVLKVNDRKIILILLNYIAVFRGGKIHYNFIFDKDDEILNYTENRILTSYINRGFNKNNLKSLKRKIVKGLVSDRF